MTNDPRDAALVRFLQRHAPEAPPADFALEERIVAATVGRVRRPLLAAALPFALAASAILALVTTHDGGRLNEEIELRLFLKENWEALVTGDPYDDTLALGGIP